MAESVKLLPALLRLLSVVRWNFPNVLPHESKHGYASFYRVVIFHLRIADTFGTETAVSTRNDDDVIITLFDDTFAAGIGVAEARMILPQNDLGIPG